MSPDPRYLQIDHRIPYEVAGNEADITNLEEFMLIDASSQRAKSWSCENCSNLTTTKSTDVCKNCFWAHPESYTHIALEEERRVSLSWRNEEVQVFDQISKHAIKQKESVQDYIKKLIQSSLSGK